MTLTEDTAPPSFDALAAQDALEHGQYRRAAALLESAPPGDAAAWRQLGQAYLRAGRTLDAELPLRRGLALGDPEARLAYGNWLRIIGQFGAAVRELDLTIAALPDGELRCLAQVSQGVALLRLGEVRAGLERCHSGWSTYPPQAEPYRRARLARVLGQMHLHLGHLETAHGFQVQAVAFLSAEPEPVARFLALRDLARVQARLGQILEAQASFGAAVQVLSADEYSDADSLRAQVLRLGAEAEELALGAEPGSRERERVALLQELCLQTGALHDSELRLWTVIHLADALSRQGQHARAMHTLYELGTPRGLPPVLSVLRGILMRRQRQYPQAIRDLEGAPGILEADPLLYWRAQLHLADALYQEAQYQGNPAHQGLAVLGRALEHLVGVEDRRFYLPDWQELAELVQHALLEPDLAPLMERLLEEPDAADHGAAHPLAEMDSPHLKLRLLGPGAATLDGEPCALSAGALLVLCYLHLSPNHSRNDMSAVLFPDFDRAQTAAFFKLAVRELRAALGPDILLLDDTLRHPRYRIGEVRVDLDLSALRRALAHSDLGAALLVYRGAFLSDLSPESDWADGLRGELHLTLNLELQQALNAALSAPELRRVLKLAGRFLDIDPDIGEAAPELDAALDAARERLDLSAR